MSSFGVYFVVVLLRASLKDVVDVNLLSCSSLPQKVCQNKDAKRNLRFVCPGVHVPRADPPLELRLLAPVYFVDMVGTQPFISIEATYSAAYDSALAAACGYGGTPSEILYFVLQQNRSIVLHTLRQWSNFHDHGGYALIFAATSVILLQLSIIRGGSDAVVPIQRGIEENRVTGVYDYPSLYTSVTRFPKNGKGSGGTGGEEDFRRTL
jgi:hypothetical protein